MQENNFSVRASGAAIMLFAAVFGVGQLMQGAKIFRSHSAETVSGLWMIATTFMLMASIIYGLGIKDRILIWSGVVRAPFAIVVTLGYFTYGHSGQAERGLLLLTGILTLITLLVRVWRMNMMKIAMGLITIFSLHQPYQIWLKKSSGKLSLTMLICFTVSTVFWVIYARERKIWPIFWFSLVSLGILVPTIGLWLWYH